MIQTSHSYEILYLIINWISGTLQLPAAVPPTLGGQQQREVLSQVHTAWMKSIFILLKLRYEHIFPFFSDNKCKSVSQWE